MVPVPGLRALRIGARSCPARQPTARHGPTLEASKQAAPKWNPQTPKDSQRYKCCVTNMSPECYGLMKRGVVQTFDAVIFAAHRQKPRHAKVCVP